MTDEELKAIEDRCDKATAGPWEGRFQFDNPSRVYLINAPIDRSGIACFGSSSLRAEGKMEDTGQFIAHAREDVPALLEEIKIQKEMLNTLCDEDTSECPRLQGYKCLEDLPEDCGCSFCSIWRQGDDFHSCWMYAAREEAKKRIKEEKIVDAKSKVG